MDIAVPTDNPVRHTLAMQRLADRRDGAPPPEQRLAALASLDATLRANRDAIAEAISVDFGHRAHQETILAELVPSLSAIRHARRNLKRWLRPEKRRVDIAFQPGRAWVEWQPLGCVGIVSPWNYPLLLTVSPLVDALAAGNRVIVKPSEMTPRFAALFAVLMHEAIDPAQVSVITGGPDTARALCALPLDHLLFTGSTAIGREVARAAAENLTPVTLELGGKSPALLFRDYDMAAAARSIALGKFFNAGQTCIAPDYVLAPEEHAPRFAQMLLDAAKRLYPRIGGNPDYTSIISDHHHQRLYAILREAEAAGATLLRLGDSYAERRLGPTIVLNPPLDGRLMQEEIFGPIIPVIGYREVNDAFRFIRDRPRPLALYPFTKDPAKLRAAMTGTISGGVCVNSTLMQCIQDDLPFGGVGLSGIGAYHGQDGFRRFSHARGVYQPGRVRGFEFLAPPYGRKMRLALRAMLLR
ncbi:coniferyl aldehyde dehydrogenase [Acidisphaera sp. L21]|uniref:coniferyl aldehyde dehydrogenase n=1 Tax=Acidisphaera sp. L21 TaxID=1641851 RepID=UPI00131E1A74|nr:coniferyl aldehyde dehydrogenase [Acidisphaera sp. L21]